MLGSFFRNRDLESTEAYYQARRAFSIDPKQDLIRVRARTGLEASQIYAQMYFAQQTRFKRFRREIELHKDRLNTLNKDYDVLIVLPPKGLLPKTAIQQMHRQSMGLATSAGFAFVSQAQLNTDRVVLGAKRLNQLLLEKKKQNRRVILVSHSYGSAFVRVMLDQSQPKDLSPVQGWLNLSGAIFGSALYNCSDRIQWFFHSTPSQRTFSCEQAHFKRSLRTQSFKSVHILGMKGAANRQEQRLHERLRAWGPNDGIIHFAPYQKIEQTVVPLIDQGHVIDLSRLSMTFIRTLSSMVSTIPKTKSWPQSELKGLDFRN